VNHTEDPGNGRKGGDAPVTSRESVPVSELLGDDLSDLHLRVLSGESHLDNEITHPRVQKPGLAFAGYFPYVKDCSEPWLKVVPQAPGEQPTAPRLAP